jgi:hypothetical protein
MHGENNEEILFKLANLYPLVDSIINIGKQHNLNYILTGHLSLIVLFEKVYREPSDIDLVIDGKQIRKWMQVLSREWRPLFSENQILQAEGFVEKIFASSCGTIHSENSNECIFNVNKSEVCYLATNNTAESNFDNINKIFIDKELVHDRNLEANNEKIQLIQNPWVIHSPNENSPFGGKQFEDINGEYFRVSFKIPQIINRGKNHSAYIVIFDNSGNIAQTEALYEEIEIKKENQLESESWWISDFIKRQADIFSYQIYIKRDDILLSFLNINGIKLEMIIDGEFSNLKYIEKNICGDVINLSPPERLFARKYGRQKDFDDMNFFKN